jgi:hypothetical protein
MEAEDAGGVVGEDGNLVGTQVHCKLQISNCKLQNEESGRKDLCRIKAWRYNNPCNSVMKKTS